MHVNRDPTLVVAAFETAYAVGGASSKCDERAFFFAVGQSSSETRYALAIGGSKSAQTLETCLR